MYELRVYVWCSLSTSTSLQVVRWTRIIFFSHLLQWLQLRVATVCVCVQRSIRAHNIEFSFQFNWRTFINSEQKKTIHRNEKEMEKNFTEFHFVERKRIRNVIFKSCLRTVRSEEVNTKQEWERGREREQKIKLQTMKHKRNNNNKNMLNKYICAFNIQTTMKIDFFSSLRFLAFVCSFRIPWSSSSAVTRFGRGTSSEHHCNLRSRKRWIWIRGRVSKSYFFVVCFYLVLRKYEMSRTIKVCGEIFIVSLFTAGEGIILHKCMCVYFVRGMHAGNRIENETKPNFYYDWMKPESRATPARLLYKYSSTHCMRKQPQRFYGSSIGLAMLPRARRKTNAQKEKRKISAEGRKKEKK